MRRFVDTFAGKALCHLAVMALVLPTVTLGVAGKAQAQVTQLPSWAVTEFKDLKGNASLKYGQLAADDVASELAKTNKYDVVSQESVKRSIETLGLTSPLEGIVNLTRVGQDVHAGTIVTGEILDYQVRAVGGGKEAIVAVRMVAYDVAGGLPVNGALEKGESTIRGNNVANDVLINDAIAQAAAVAVRTMQGQTTPSGTVLNTTDRRALINQGSRSGFRTGDTVIITRNGQQVGTGRVGDLEADQAEITPERSERQGLGVAPGDRVRGVFNPPALPPLGYDVIKANGDLARAKNGRRGASNNATLISALLVVGLLAVLLGSGNNSKGTDSGNATAEATLDSDGVSPGVRVSFTTNGFFKGANSVSAFQIYRPTDVPANPIAVVSNQTGSRFYIDAIDTTRPTSQTYFTSNQIGGTTCNASSVNASFTSDAAPLVTPGRPYYYQIAAVYTVSQRDLPSSSTGGSTSTTAGNSTATTSTAGNTTSGTTGVSTATSASTAGATTASTAGTSTATTAGTTSGSTTSTSGDVLCYFISGRSTTGQATPLYRPTLTAPSSGAALSSTNATLATQAFTFTSTQSSNAITNPAYVIEFSDDPNFSGNRTIRLGDDYRTSPNALSFRVPTLGSNFTGKKLSGGGTLATAATTYYRVGVRNRTDNPGPVKDSGTGQRYIYSTPRYFTRSANPPATP